eukprot:scaffold153537_cov35-Prasinocladus_malaysianus.AAC.1
MSCDSQLGSVERQAWANEKSKRISFRVLGKHLLIPTGGDQTSACVETASHFHFYLVKVEIDTMQSIYM